MAIKDWLWLIVTIIGMVAGTILYVNETFASNEALKDSNATLQNIHQYDFYEAKQEYYSDRVARLQEKKEAVGLTESQEYDLEHYREEIQRLQEAQEGLLNKIAE